ncbi:MAG: methyl-accepting chemotaxis protein [Cellulosilyticaceae bacterium]
MNTQITKREQEINHIIKRILGWCLIVLLILAVIKVFVAPVGYFTSVRGFLYCIQWFFVLVPFLGYKKWGNTPYYKHMALVGMQLCNMSLYLSSWIYGAIVGIITIYLAALYDDRTLIIRYILINTVTFIIIGISVITIDAGMTFVVGTKSMLLFIGYVTIEIIALGIIMLVGSETNRSLTAEGEALRKAIELQRDEVRTIASSLQDAVKILGKKLEESTDAVQMVSSHMASIVNETQEGIEALESIKIWMQKARLEVGNLHEHTKVVMSNTAVIGEQATSNQEKISRVVKDMGELQTLNGHSEEVVTALISQMKQINASLTLIAKVTAQTNLLSLNARIEAARAGQFGAGFAVVAVEIQKLADASAGASEEIGKQIQQMNLRIEDVISYIGNVHHLIGQNTTAIEGMSGDYQSLYRVQNDNSRQVELVSTAIGMISEQSQTMEEQVDEVTGKNKENLEHVTSISAALQELTATIGEISEQTARIYEMSEKQ